LDWQLQPRPPVDRINTEVGVMIDSPEIATQVAAFMEDAMAPRSAYHVTLDEKGNLLWTMEIDG